MQPHANGKLKMAELFDHCAFEYSKIYMHDLSGLVFFLLWLLVACACPNGTCLYYSV